MKIWRATPLRPIPEAALDTYPEWEAEYEREQKQEELRRQQRTLQRAAEEVEERQNAESYARLFGEDTTDDVAPNQILDQWREDSEDDSSIDGLHFDQPQPSRPAWMDLFTPEEYAKTMAETEAFWEDARALMKHLRGE